jgi:hypothetical protein
MEGEGSWLEKCVLCKAEVRSKAIDGFKSFDNPDDTVQGVRTLVGLVCRDCMPRHDMVIREVIQSARSLGKSPNTGTIRKEMRKKLGL